MSDTTALCITAVNFAILAIVHEIEIRQLRKELREIKGENK